jgi:hypothetical protein
MQVAPLILSLLFVVIMGSCIARKPTNEAPAEHHLSENETVSSELAGGQVIETAESSSGPKTVRDFFELLPDEYFLLEGCDRQTDNDCKEARREYLKNFTEIEDIRNGYFKGGCDGAQALSLIHI